MRSISRSLRVRLIHSSGYGVGALLEKQAGLKHYHQAHELCIENSEQMCYYKMEKENRRV